jgi:arsenate reductase (thioredoxin)
MRANEGDADSGGCNADGQTPEIRLNFCYATTPPMTRPDSPYNVLFLCTGNSARSIMVESILRAMGGGRFGAHSAGSRPTGTANRYALEYLQKSHLPTDGLRSKSWDEFARPEAPRLDFIFTVCDNAAGEICPVWSGRPTTAHWGIPDPAAVEGSDEDKRKAFAQASGTLLDRIRAFISLPLARLDRLSLQRRLSELGQLQTDARAS